MYRRVIINIKEKMVGINRDSNMKLVHIMPHKSVIHNQRLVKMFLENKKFFRDDEHIFVIGKKNVYENGLNELESVILEEDIADNYKKFCNYIDGANFVFLHENMAISNKVLLRLGRKRLKKIIWCVWGHDLYWDDLEKLNMYASLRRFLSLSLRKAITKKFYAVGISFEYDSLEVRKKYGKIPIVYGSYWYVKNNKKMIDNIIRKKVGSNGGPLRVLIGHSAYDFHNHFDTIERLKKFADEDILITMVLAYGDREYASLVKEKAIQTFGNNKVEFIEKIESTESYRRYLATIDVAIFNFKKQAALGNFCDLCYMEKKIFLAKDGVLDMAAKLEGLETYNVEDIDKMSFEDFSDNNSKRRVEKAFASFYIDEKNAIYGWKRTLDNLRNGIKDTDIASYFKKKNWRE